MVIEKDGSLDKNQGGKLLKQKINKNYKLKQLPLFPFPLNYYMKNIISLFCLLLFHNYCFCQNNNEIKRNIDTYLKQVQLVNQIPGMAVAVVKKGKIIYESYYGKSSIETNSFVNKNTLFGIFSTTKLVSTVGVFQLIEKNNLNLDDKISKYIDSLPKEWKEIKIKNLLTHSSGLPDIVRFEDIPYTLSNIEKLQRLSQKQMQFETGNQFRYNQTNFWLLTMIIEKITGNSFDNYILENQFPSAKSNVIFSSNRNEIIKDRANKYDYNNTLKKYIKNTVNNGISAHSGNGLNITLSELIGWNENLDKNILLKKETKAIMWTPFNFKNQNDDFLYGWGQYKINNKVSYGFSGGNVTAFRKFLNSDMTIIFLSNGYKYFDVQDQVINHIAGIVDKNLIDPYLLSEEELTSNFLNAPFQKAKENYLSTKAKNPKWNFENKLNNIGYALIKDNRINDAIKIFELNTNENPNSGDAFDSLGEGYYIIGQYKISKKHYEKSLKLSPENLNAKEMIGKIDKLLKNKQAY